MFGIDDALGFGLGAVGSALQARSQSRLMDKQMAFQERMSNTSWQRGVADMRKAGINPMLAAGAQGGASAPSGAGPGDVPNPVGAGVSSAVGLKDLGLRTAMNRAKVHETNMAAFKSLSDGLARQAESLDAFVSDGSVPQLADPSGRGPITGRQGLRRAIMQAQLDAIGAGATSARAAARLSSGKANVYEAFAPYLQKAGSGARQLMRLLGEPE